MERMMQSDALLIVYLIAAFLGGFVFALTWEVSTLRIGHWAYQKGYHFHHSLFGIAAFLFVPLFWEESNKVIVLLGFGTGIIVQHSIKEGFRFITKD
jgi:hypothetical protein